MILQCWKGGMLVTLHMLHFFKAHKCNFLCRQASMYMKHDPK